MPTFEVPTTTTPKWHDIYKAALLETDWSRMEDRIQAAEAAIQDRKHEFGLNMAELQRKTRRSRTPCAA
jgi:hypothetical protein